MDYTIETLNDIVILEIRGQWINVTGEDSVHEVIKKHVHRDMETGARHVIVDLEHCRFMASGGMGALIAIRISAATHGGKVLLCCVSDRVRRSLVVGGVWGLFDAYATRGEALRALAPQPTTP